MGRFTFLQEQQISYGKEHGLLEEEIKVYKKRRFNYLQMQEIRLGFEQGLSERDIRRYAHFWMKHENMKQIREILKEGDRDAVPVILPGGVGGKDALYFAGMVCMILSSLWTAAGMLASEPDLVLTAEEITLNCGDVFLPANYVWQLGEDAKLTLPNGISTMVPGKYLAVYRAVSEHGTKEKTLLVKVVDTAAPDLVLSENTLEIERGELFRCRDYILKAEDAVSGILAAQVGCSSYLPEEVSEHEVVYRVSDHSGNVAEAVLVVRISDPVTESEE